jgi:hypothetical protein
MRRLIVTALWIVWLPLVVAAQGTDASRGHGYVYFAPGVTSPGGTGTMHLGAGGEGFFTRNLGLGADVGYVAPFESFTDGIGTFAPNFVTRFRAKSDDNKVEPFVSGGYTLFFREGTANGVNFGGGLNYWFRERLGLRFEVRDNVMIANGETGHFVGLRVGLTFR